MHDVQKVLFIVSYSGKDIGGHKISAVSLAQGLSDAGYAVGMLIEQPEFDLPDAQGGGFTLHNVPYPQNGLRAAWIRSREILRLVRRHHYGAIVAMDIIAGRHALLSALWDAVPLVQVQAGGPVKWLKPLNFPGILSFSEELIEGYHRLCHIPLDYMTLASGRVDFQRFTSGTQQKNGLSAPSGLYHVMCISRLEQDKATAIIHLLDQISAVSAHTPVELTIVGDGEARPRLEAYACEIGVDSQVTFAGRYRVTTADLTGAHLVVGQGRTVIEALACHVPAAVCGAEGYYGLLTPDNFAELALTNLTGRTLDCRGSLAADLAALGQYHKDLEPEIFTRAYAQYDLHNGVQGIRTAIRNIKTALPWAWQRRVRLCAALIQLTTDRASDFLSRRLTITTRLVGTPARAHSDR